MCNTSEIFKKGFFSADVLLLHFDFYFDNDKKEILYEGENQGKISNWSRYETVGPSSNEKFRKLSEIHATKEIIWIVVSSGTFSG